MGELPRHQPGTESTVCNRHRGQKRQRFQTLALSALLLIVLLYIPSFWALFPSDSIAEQLSVDADRILSRCAEVKATPGPPADFYSRTQSNRFEPGTKSVLIQNATIWTGSDSGKEQFKGDILLDGGIIKWIGGNGLDQAPSYDRQGITTVDAQGAWVTPG
jgi:hypothetical protein